MTRPFRFSVTATNQPLDQLAHVAQRAAELGYSTLSLPDHLDDQAAPLPALLAAALAAPAIRILPLVLANDYRHPAVLAKEIATIDVLTGGRIELGIGAGWMHSDYEQSGLNFDRPGIRIARLEESLRVLKGLFDDGPLDFAGEHYRITGMDGTPKPHQRPHPPIMVAGGAQRILTVAGRHADIVGINPSLAAGVIDPRAGSTATPAATDQKLAWIRDAAADRFDAIEIHTRVHLAMITDDRDGVAAMMAPALGIDAEDALASPHALVGTVDQCAETLLRWRDRWGISYIGINADVMESMAPVLDRLAGR